jgi:hypothetical protein
MKERLGLNKVGAATQGLDRDERSSAMVIPLEERKKPKTNNERRSCQLLPLQLPARPCYPRASHGFSAG